MSSPTIATIVEMVESLPEEIQESSGANEKEIEEQRKVSID